MYNIEQTQKLFNQTKTLLNLINELYSVEDNYLEAWLMLGVPDGESPMEIMQDLEDDPKQFSEWYRLAMKLLIARQEDEDLEEEW